jgi:sugar phosphate isomerase/epimerase
MYEKKNEAVGATRREFLAAAGACAVALNMGTAWGAGGGAKSQMGLATDVWDLHDRVQAARGQKRDVADPLTFLERCVELGAAGMQGPLGVRDAEYTTKLRRFAEERQLYIEGSIVLEGQRLDWGTVEKEMATAKEAGAKVVRVVTMPGRRYEAFKARAEFEAASARALEVLQRVEPMAAKHRVRIAVENHKDHRIGEQLEMLKKVSSEWIGMCVDFGNSFALCEDSLEVARAYAPWAYSAHIKDQAVRESENGFLFGDAPLGQGFLELPEMIRILREAHPEMKFSLEVMTRDPLVVPVLSERYWATMGNVPATDLARTMRTVKSKGAKQALATISGLSADEQMAAETRNIVESLAWGKERMK